MRLTFEFLVLRVIEVSDFVGSCTVRIVPNVIIDCAEPIHSIFNLHWNSVIGNYTILRIL